MIKFSGICFLFLCGATVAFAQTAAPVNPVPQDGRQEIRRRENNQAGRLTDKSGGSARPVFVRRGTLAFRKRLNKDQKKILAPDVADANRYAAFLKNPDAGLMKIFPDLGCEDNAQIVRADEICLNQVPMSAFYSFREKEHTIDYLADIRLKKEMLISDGLLAQGILVALGNAPLENVTPTSAGMKFLNEFQPEEMSERALEQTLQLIKGVKADGYFYRKGLPAQENTTYALRVVAYRGKIIQPIRGFPFDMLGDDDRVDLTIAFRLLKKDAATGNYTVLWKEIARRDAPKIIYPKRKQSGNNRRSR